MIIGTVGAKTMEGVSNMGRFARFAWQSMMASFRNCLSPCTYPLIWTQMNIIGVRSVPVVMITGAFVGMTAAVMLAGRIGGALTAELGTMNVTEQIDAMRSMGTDPIKYLAAPRVMACLLLTPFLIIYADFMGIVGGYLVSVVQLGINNRAYWDFSASGVELWDVSIGIIKGLFFGVAIAVISCYKGFTCKEGAQGVGQACTEAFVASFISILALDFALAVIFKSIYNTFWTLKSLV